MKKHYIFAVILTLAISLAACGRRNETPNTDMTILPGINPTIGTNIPDPEVDTKMPMYTDGTEMGGWTDPIGSDFETNGRTQNNN